MDLSHVGSQINGAYYVISSTLAILGVLAGMFSHGKNAKKIEDLQSKLADAQNVADTAHAIAQTAVTSVQATQTSLTNLAAQTPTPAPIYMMNAPSTPAPDSAKEATVGH